MAANNLYVYHANGPEIGQRADSGGFTVQVPSSADAGVAMQFDAQYWRTGAAYVSTDVVFLVARRTATVGGVTRTWELEYPLTYSGNLWTYTPDTTHWNSFGQEPGSTVTWDAQFVIRGDTGTGAAPIKAETAKFSLRVSRGFPIAPQKFGTVVGHYTAWDLAEHLSYSDAVSTWYDRSGLERNLTEATNTPTFQYDSMGRPHVRFDGSNDVLASTLLFPATGTMLVACRYRAIDATARPVASWGASSIGGAYLDTTAPVARWDNAGSATNVTTTGTPSVNEWMILGATKTDDGNQNVIFNLTAGTAAGTEANAPGVLRLAYDGTSFANVDIGEIQFFNTVLDTTFTGTLEDAVRCMHSFWGVGA